MTGKSTDKKIPISFLFHQTVLTNLEEHCSILSWLIRIQGNRPKKDGKNIL